MIGPKQPRPTRVDEKAAYNACTFRDEGRCVRCRRGPSVQRDHRKNRSQGGLTVPSNLQLLCADCHEWKTSHPDEAVREGWAVPGWADPLEWPARRWLPTPFGTLREGWVLYGDHGSWEPISDVDAEARMSRVVVLADERKRARRAAFAAAVKQEPPWGPSGGDAA